MVTYSRPPLPKGVLTLPARYYTHPAHFEREMERIRAALRSSGYPDAVINTETLPASMVRLTASP